MTFLWLEFKWALNQAFRTIVPHEEHRIPITFNTGIYPIALYTPFVFLAYLTRRPDTYLIRLLLLPSVITSVLVAAYWFRWTIPEQNVYNWGQSLLAATVISKALEFGFTKEGILKVGESRPGMKKGKDKSTQNGSAHAHAPEEHDARHPYIATWLYDAVEVSHTMRGLKWKFGRGIHIPKQTRPLERSAFLQATFSSFVYYFIVLDLLESLVKLFPGVGEPLGGSMFYPELSPPARYTVSTIVHLFTGAALLSGFKMVYDLITFLAVWLLDSAPESWPPVMDDPWSSDSMHKFWSKDWHQLLRNTFIVYGGYPGKWLAGSLGMLFGTFIASGLFHECAIYAMGRGIDANAMLFFTAQAPVLLLERVWRRVTGRRVSGTLGKSWVWFIMFIAAQPMVDSWHRRGLGGGMVIPPIFSPTRWMLLPLARKLLGANVSRQVGILPPLTD